MIEKFSRLTVLILSLWIDCNVAHKVLENILIFIILQIATFLDDKEGNREY